MARTHRFQILFTEEEAEQLKAESERRGIPMAEILRDCVKSLPKPSKSKKRETTMTKQAVFEETTDQYYALGKAKEHWGRSWKSKLIFAWESGDYPATLKPYRAELQQVRNGGGPSWLKKFKFDA